MLMLATSQKIFSMRKDHLERRWGVAIVNRVAISRILSGVDQGPRFNLQHKYIPCLLRALVDLIKDLNSDTLSE